MSSEIEQGKGEILVVDDTPANLKLLMDMLMSHGYKVRPAVSGEQALAAVSMRQPELILLDIKMPGIDGYEVCRRLKSDTNSQEIPVIFISALDTLGDRVKGFNLGAVDYITKPFQREEVLVRVHTHLQLRRMQTHLEELVDERTQEVLLVNERLKQAQQIAHIGSWEWDIVNGQVIWSDELYRILGHEPHKFEPSYDSFIESIHPDDRKYSEDETKLSLVPPFKNLDIEHRIIRPDGTERIIHERAEVIHEGGVAKRLVGTSLDISERKAAEESEHRSEIKMRSILLQTIRAIAMTVEKRDPYTSGHQQRVADLAVAIAREMELDENIIEGIGLGALIHDIGKIYIPAEILNRPGKLSDMEFQMIKAHSEVGYEIVKDVEFPWPVANMIHQHHERLDGSGYPQGLSGDEIIQEARILAVADVVEAITSHRPYRASLGIEVGLEEILKNRGSTYDPVVVDSCVKLFRENSFSLERSN